MEERINNVEAKFVHTTAADPGAAAAAAAAFSGTQQELSDDYVIPLIPGRTYKDTVFNYLFRHKKEALSLFNAINGTHLTDPEELRIVTLDTGIYLSYKNDVAFMIGDELNLYEQQSTEDPNMPLRGLFYFAAEYQRIIRDRQLNIYGTKLLQLPTPRFVILCNAEDMKEERQILRLSDSFSGKNASLECTAEVLNINAGHNQDLLNGCRTLSEYAALIGYVRSYQKLGFVLTTAITLAVERCIKENILRDFLISDKEKVIGMIFDEYDEKEQRKLDKRDAFEEGEEIGKKEGKKEAKIEALLEFLSALDSVPDDLQKAIKQETDLGQLQNWLTMAFHSKSIAEFREKAKL